MVVLGSPAEVEAALGRALVPVGVERTALRFGGSVSRHDFGGGVALAEGPKGDDVHEPL